MSIKIGNNIVAKSSTYHPDLFDVKWSDHILDNISWLRADTFSWHSGELYNKAYEHLLEEWNEVGDNPETEIIEGIQIWYRLAPDGHKICTKSQEDEIMQIYEATGVAWYYIIDTDNHRFKLPRTKFGFAGIRSGVGNYVEAGLPNITGDGLHEVQGNMAQPSGDTNAFYPYNVVSGSNTSYSSGSYQHYDISFDASRSSSVYGNSNTVQPKTTEMYLYFYVGNFTQSSLENIASTTTETLNNKLDIDLVNAPSDTKIALLGMLFPDYTRGINISNGATSSVYGWFYIAGHGYSGTSTVSLNGNVVYTGTDHSNERLSNTCILLVKPNDVISWSGWQGGISMATIYPCNI